MKKEHIIYNYSLKDYKVFGSSSPSEFKHRLQHIPKEEMKQIVAVFVDVLRCTTTCLAMGASGAATISLRKKPQTGDIIQDIGQDDKLTIIAGEQNGRRIKVCNNDGQMVDAQYSNSPLELKGENLKDTNVVFYSTNGAVAFQSIANAGFHSIYAMAMPNIEATADAIIASGIKRVWLVSSGFYDGSCMEDSIANGLLVDKLVRKGFCTKQELDDGTDAMRYRALPFMDNGNLIPLELKEHLKHRQVQKLLRNLTDNEHDLAACIDGTGIEDLWPIMQKTILVCNDFDTNQLVAKSV